MSNRFPRLDALPVAQRALWPALEIVRSEGFVLYGGTAIALHLGHRPSIDFDFFTDRAFDPENLLSRFSFLQGAEVLQEEPNTLTALARRTAAEPVKLSFFGGLSFGRLADPHETPDRVLEVASLPDLLAHKLKVILQRVDAKDYVDISAVLQSGLALPDGLAGARALYPQFPAQEALKALTYFQGGNLHLLPEETRKYLVSAANKVRAIPAARIVSPHLSVTSR